VGNRWAVKSASFGSDIQVLIACPGRLVDHLERGTTKLDRIELLVVDEADRMLDMGFLPQLLKILRVMKKPPQTLMFSATMDPQSSRWRVSSRPGIARLGWAWHQPDVGYVVLCILEVMGLVTDVRRSRAAAS
jgi:hypothetical protein